MSSQSKISKHINNQSTTREWADTGLDHIPTQEPQVKNYWLEITKSLCLNIKKKIKKETQKNISSRSGNGVKRDS